MNLIRAIISEQNCGCQSYKELRIAFGDLDNCQLKCPFCFTLEQSPANQPLSAIRRTRLENIKIIRFTGGEPFINQRQIDGILEELTQLNSYQMSNLDLIVLQTNAIGIENKEIEDFIKLKNLPILFEVSFKGTNVSEYRYLTHNEILNEQQASAIMKNQIDGYKYLSSLFDNFQHIRILARLGVFHSSLKNPTFKFVFPETDRLMFDPDFWDNRIKEIVEHQNNLWGNTFEKKLTVEKLKTPADGSPGIGRRYRRIIEILKKSGILIEVKSSLPSKFSNKYLYKRGNEIYWRASANLKNNGIYNVLS